MVGFIVRRTILGFSTLVFISIISFVIIQLPEGDFLTAFLAAAQGGTSFTGEVQLAPKEIEKLREFYGLDRPLYVQYLTWVANMGRGEFGLALDRYVPVLDIIGERIALTAILALGTVLFTWSWRSPSASTRRSASTR